MKAFKATQRSIKIKIYINFFSSSGIGTGRVKKYDLTPEEQKGGVSEKQGTIDQLLIDSMVLDHSKQNQRNLFTAWLDYRQAFDSIPHDWLNQSLKIHKFPPKIKNFPSTLMKNGKLLCRSLLQIKPSRLTLFKS